MDRDRKAPRVLLVDDDSHLRAGLRRLLHRHYHLEEATDGRQALEKLSHDRFAVMVTDLNMPQMDGFELLDLAKELSPDTVRVVLTGQADLERVLRAVNEGYVYRFLLKPCAPEELTQSVGSALEQFQRQQAARELAGLRKLNQALEGIVMGFSRLVEARDPYTAGHQQRVAQLAEAIARRLGLAPEMVESVRVAAMVHDLGKIYVPAEFLNRPGRLTPVEFQIIRTHPEVGAEALKPLDFHWPISEIVLQHHERLDGSGYPRGLAGVEILEQARIIAVADVTEAMSSHRPYRPGLGLDAALAELESGSGRIYAPEVVEVCQELFLRQGWSFDLPDPLTNNR
ncbi:MAG: HD domain-containing phosphohydrolase [Pseudomonadota bacterium]